MFAKQGIDHAWDVSFEDALSWEGQSQAICFATEDVAEGIGAFIDKRLPQWKGK
jgi:2-(1,2-epoxy-1,2-dihydrophenyl)acetyl-CoA isomerase